MNLTDVMVARDEQWTRATTADERAAIRAEYVAAGWTICDHESCPPFDCRH